MTVILNQATFCEQLGNLMKGRSTVDQLRKYQALQDAVCAVDSDIVARFECAFPGVSELTPGARRRATHQYYYTLLQECDLRIRRFGTESEIKVFPNIEEIWRNAILSQTSCGEDLSLPRLALHNTSSGLLFRRRTHRIGSTLSELQLSMAKTVAVTWGDKTHDVVITHAQRLSEVVVKIIHAIAGLDNTSPAVCNDLYGVIFECIETDLFEPLAVRRGMDDHEYKMVLAHTLVYGQSK